MEHQILFSGDSIGSNGPILLTGNLLKSHEYTITRRLGYWGQSLDQVSFSRVGYSPEPTMVFLPSASVAVGAVKKKKISEVPQLPPKSVQIVLRV